MRGLRIGCCASSPRARHRVRDRRAARSSRPPGSSSGSSARRRKVSIPLLPPAGAIFMACATGQPRPPPPLAPQPPRRLRPGHAPSPPHREPAAPSHQQVATRARAALRSDVLAALGRHDLLLAPDRPSAAPTIAEHVGGEEPEDAAGKSSRDARTALRRRWPACPPSRACGSTRRGCRSAFSSWGGRSRTPRAESSDLRRGRRSWYIGGGRRLSNSARLFM